MELCLGLSSALTAQDQAHSEGLLGLQHPRRPSWRKRAIGGHGGRTQRRSESGWEGGLWAAALDLGGHRTGSQVTY